MILFFQKLALKSRLIGVLLAFLAVLAGFLLFNSTPWGLSQLRQLSGGVGLSDQRFWYTAPDLAAILTAWGSAGRQHYLTVLLPLDGIFPLAYGGFFLISILYLLKRMNPQWVWWYLLPLVPVVATVLDELENLSLLILSLLFPIQIPAIVLAAALFTATKWVLIGASGLIIVSLIAGHLFQRSRVLFLP